MIPLLRKHEVGIVLAAILLANAAFVTLIANKMLPVGLYNYGRFALLAGVLFGLVFLSRRLEGVVDILRPMVEWRRSPKFYLFAILWTVAICSLVLLVKGMLAGDFSYLGEIKAGLAKISHPKLIVTLAVSSFVGEIVWVSYAIRALSKSFSPFVSALIVGAVWTAWWMPMAIFNFGIIPNLPLIALLFNQTGIAAMCAFVYFHTRSGFLVLIMQIVFNATILVFPITPDIGGVGTYWAFALTYFFAAVLLYLKFGPTPLFNVDNEQTEGNQAGERVAA